MALKPASSRRAAGYAESLNRARVGLKVLNSLAEPQRAQRFESSQGGNETNKISQNRGARREFKSNQGGLETLYPGGILSAKARFESNQGGCFASDGVGDLSFNSYISSSNLREAL